MFDFLKKKIGGFIDSLTKKEEEKGEPPEKERGEAEKALIEEEKIPIEAPEPETGPGPEKKEEERFELVIPEKKVEYELVISEEKIEKKEEPEDEMKVPVEVRKEAPKPERKIPEIKIGEKRIEERVPEGEAGKEPQKKQKTKTPLPPEEKPRERVKLGIVSAVKSLITREVEITESDVKEMADSFELELLEADVDLQVAESIKQELLSKLVGKKMPKETLHSFVSGSIKETLVGILANEKAFDIAERVGAGERPLKIMFFGINGAGKTTTIAKVARMLQGRNRKVVFAAADTFRAAAIEQMSVHAERLGVKVIKRDYGSDPTSVAYDAVNYAKAHGIDAVLIDTAGRQDTNISLINEMKKMNRVIQPDLKIYIGESIAGNAIIEQISAFNREIGIDGVILTKLDCDPKGGTMLSISRATGIPVIYVGTGQKYEDLELFDPARIVERIVE
jgi:fused signal recognition particle receptor